MTWILYISVLHFKVSTIVVPLARGCWETKNDKWYIISITQKLMYSKCWVDTGWSQQRGDVHVTGKVSHSPSLQNISPFPLVQWEAKRLFLDSHSVSRCEKQSESVNGVSREHKTQFVCEGDSWGGNGQTKYAWRLHAFLPCCLMWCGTV